MADVERPWRSAALAKLPQLHAGHKAAQRIEVVGDAAHRIILFLRMVGSIVSDFKNHHRSLGLHGQSSAVSPQMSDSPAPESDIWGLTAL
ncbi:hypothetical protein, partial [Xanthomonas fragariae]|uniref:hypothetical protein n=1 Tax=Xanthomonas fragariae TaxID=48664 RepID=UPI0031B57D3F